MKLNREQITELFGSAPDEQENKKLVGVENIIPKPGDIYYNSGGWMENFTGDYNTRRQVAIFKDTHRPDGTPTSITELPVVEGYRLEYVGMGVKDTKGANMYYYLKPNIGEWWSSSHKFTEGNLNVHYALAYKIAKPTTLEDLYPIGNENIWLLSEGSTSAIALGCVYHGDLSFMRNLDDEYSGVDELINQGIKWSHSHRTAYAEANLFII